MRTIRLTKPVRLGEGGELVTELKLREEIVAGDMRGIPMREPMLWDDMLKLASRLSGQPELLINKLSIEDTTTVMGAVGSFFGAGQETGSGPSLQ